MLMVLFLLSMTGDDAPKVAAPPNPSETTSRQARCENAHDQLAGEGEGPAPTLRSLDKESLANAYRPVVRYAHCDKPVLIAKEIGQQQR
jgi:hypothetical protein